jgi:hypothetical protein
VTTERRYTCNLCRARLVQQAEGRGDIEGTGILFGSSVDCSGTKFTELHEAENHICEPCLNFLRKSAP